MAVTPPTITKRLVKQQPLTASEMDTNIGDLLDYTTDVESSYSGGTGAITGLCLTNLTVPIGSINPTGSTDGEVLTSTGPSTSPAWESLPDPPDLATHEALRSSETVYGHPKIHVSGTTLYIVTT